mmetsp:Transcript_3564/g.2592  ORF Transcript_3564/g.2592 Transcript_3564/m.2592 type:complete len:154 (+) Transcript_3564:1322-1783(+)
MFDVWFEDENKEKKFVWQTSWGFTTRSIGVMVMLHSDNKGLVLPPRVAQYQVVLIPIVHKADDHKSILQKIDELAHQLKQGGIRVFVDDRDNYNPGWKFNHWELKGIPLRVELGRNDLAAGEVRVVRRDDGSKQQVKQSELVGVASDLLEQIH